MEKIKVALTRDDIGTLPDEPAFLSAAADAGWSEDPGTGKAVMLPDERGNDAYEVFNPIPVAPPIGYVPGQSIEQLIADRVKAEYKLLQGDDEVDDIVDAEDFDIPDELPQLETIFEFMGMEPEAPELREKQVSPAERAKAELDYEELKDREKRLRVKRARIEYERRRSEEDDLYGRDLGPQSPSTERALKRYEDQRRRMENDRRRDEDDD